MRALILIALLASSFSAQADWDSLWRNTEQRGDALLQQGNAAQAARTYTDPQHQAYARIRAGDYAAAARELASLKDKDSDYNRGIALAHTNDLQGALDAFDAALKLDPKDKDARHNRELVEKALKQSKSAAGPQDKRQDNKAENEKSASPGQAKADKHASEGKNGQNKPDDNSTKKSKSADSGQSQAKSAGHEKSANGKANQAQQAAVDGSEKPSSAAHSPAAIERSGQRQASAAQTNNAPPSEKQMAQEQWLRSIPDDPGGLLRRKFMIEYMMRKQQP